NWRPQSPFHSLSVVRVNGVRPAVRRVVHRLARPSPDFLVSWAHIDSLVAGGVCDPKNFLDGFGQLSEAFLTDLKLRKSLFSLALSGTDGECKGNVLRQLIQQTKLLRVEKAELASVQV